MSALEPVVALSDEDEEVGVSDPLPASSPKPAGKKAATKAAAKKTAAAKPKAVASSPDQDPEPPSEAGSELEGLKKKKVNAKGKSQPPRKRPASSAGSAAPRKSKKPAAAESLATPAPSELKVKKYPYKSKGVWAISVNGKEYVQARFGHCLKPFIP